MRDSQYKSCAVQNQFTAYLIAAIKLLSTLYCISLHIRR